MRRRFSRKVSPSTIKELDAFPKVPDVCVQTSISGGTVSLLTFTLIAILAIGEFSYFQDSWIQYNYQVDTNISSKLQVNLDITVAMQCDYVGADMIDQTEIRVGESGDLQYEPTCFELTEKEKVWQRTIQTIQQQLNEEHNLLEFLIKSSFNGTTKGPRVVDSRDAPNACRIHGSLKLNKVAGNLHIMAGKPYQLSFGHAHALATKDPKVYNFSHRIDHLSFGELNPGLIHPLDGTEKITETNMHMFQYFLVVVPTEINTIKFSTNTHQYSVTEKGKELTGRRKRYEIPGILLKYDISSLKILISEKGMPTSQFLIRLCGIIGGIFTTAGLLHDLCGFIINLLRC
ncbi:endoplasmic reticulum-Golgi intermediate compartment protein 2-like isoform X1 [Chiloscyllium plagiosum]|uniref:endoplasmic reticulum-Golgi intermediate compartment protein 2-like isoform X1 n=1 Tax=Chiloscyllium plagiosum TaxID=36176 RepID=UPI001CB845CC|nr:endoplasmic reticulum-Golgi intermediate compartment protein 2-like isoform X1 [Chiloscyllium plagiosum]XP_043561562.1 endoplasmic reticulum-Golgi intermediate compartment protein 2-like isoform X1 [Chiloscyllium plagiosum]